MEAVAGRHYSILIRISGGPNVRELKIATKLANLQKKLFFFATHCCRASSGASESVIKSCLRPVFQWQQKTLLGASIQKCKKHLKNGKEPPVKAKKQSHPKKPGVVQILTTNMLTKKLRFKRNKKHWPPYYPPTPLITALTLFPNWLSILTTKHRNSLKNCKLEK